MSDDIPVIECQHEGSQFTFKCEHCGEKHYHGAAAEGHRVSHCFAYPRGYFLKKAKPLTMNDDYWWVNVYWRCTYWQLGYIYVDGKPSIGFACVDEDQGEPPAGANIIADLTDKALNELKVEFYKVMEE